MSDIPEEDDMDEVDRRYRRATALDESRPGETVRPAILSQARRLAAERLAQARDVADVQPAAQHRRWRRAALGTLAAAVLAGLLLTPHFREADVAPPSSAQTATPPNAPTVAPAMAPAAAPPPAPPSAAASASASASAFSASVSAARSSAALQGALAANRGSNPAMLARRLRRAAADGDMTVLRALLGGNDVDARDTDRRTALMLAAANGRGDAVRELLAHGADPRALDAQGRTALQLARAAGHVAVGEILERAGAASGEPP